MSDSPGCCSTYTQTMVSQSKKVNNFFPNSGGPKSTVSLIWLKSAGWLDLLLLSGSQERNVISCDSHLPVLIFRCLSLTASLSLCLHSHLDFSSVHVESPSASCFKRCLSLHIGMNKIIICFLLIDHALSSLEKSLFISV